MMWNQVCSRTIVAKISQATEKFEANENIFLSNKCERNSLSNAKTNRCMLQKLKRKSTFELQAPFRPYHSYFYCNPLLKNCIVTRPKERLIQSSEQIGDISEGDAHTQKQSCSSFESYLLTASELDALIIVHDKLDPKHIDSPNISNMRSSWSTDVNRCTCELCELRQKAIMSCVFKAKRFVDKTVNDCQTPTFVDFASNLIHLAHILLITACLRKVL